MKTLQSNRLNIYGVLVAMCISFFFLSSCKKCADEPEPVSPTIEKSLSETVWKGTEQLGETIHNISLSFYDDTHGALFREGELYSKSFIYKLVSKHIEFTFGKNVYGTIGGIWWFEKINEKEMILRGDLKNDDEIITLRRVR